VGRAGIEPATPALSRPSPRLAVTVSPSPSASPAGRRPASWPRPRPSVRERREGRVLEQGARHEQRAFARAPRIERKPVCAFASASNRSIS